MSKTEQIIVGLVAGFLCPFLTFVLFWWTSAALAMSRIVRLSDRGIAAAALAGLVLGIILDALCLKRWIACFYSTSVKIIVPVYLCCSVIALASFMGLPFGNLVLGALAGAYVGRRVYYADGGGDSLARIGRRVGVFTAVITGTEAFLIGLLALQETTAVRVLQRGLGMDRAAIAGPRGVGLVIFVCVALMALQFWCTTAAARFAFGCEKPEVG
jgi:hypothetical protein